MLVSSRLPSKTRRTRMLDLPPPLLTLLLSLSPLKRPQHQKRNPRPKNQRRMRNLLQRKRKKLLRRRRKRRKPQPQPRKPSKPTLLLKERLIHFTSIISTFHTRACHVFSYYYPGDYRLYSHS